MKLLLLFFIYTNCILLKQNIGDLTHSLRQLKKKFAFQNETIANLTKQIQLENNIQNEMLKLNKTKDSTKKEKIIKRNLVDEYNEQQFPFEKIPLKFWPSSNTHITEYSFYQNMIFELKRKKDLENYIQRKINEINTKMNHIHNMTNAIENDLNTMNHLLSLSNSITNTTHFLKQSSNELKPKINKLINFNPLLE